jgi:hypothetical protein
VVLTYNKVPYHFLELLLDEIEKKKATLIERRNKEGRIPTIMNTPYLRWGTLYLRFSINVPPMVYQERCPHCETVTGDTFMICHKEKLCPLPDISPSFRRVKERRRKSSEWKKPLDLDKLWSNSTISMNPVQPSATMDEANEDSRKKANKPNVDPEWSSQNFEDDEMDPDREKGSEPANKRVSKSEILLLILIKTINNETERKRKKNNERKEEFEHWKRNSLPESIFTLAEVHDEYWEEMEASVSEGARRRLETIERERFEELKEEIRIEKEGEMELRIKDRKVAGKECEREEELINK